MKSNEEDINRDINVDWNDGGSDMNQYETLHDKWKVIQDEYLEKHPELDTGDFYFDSGGFEGVLEKISEIRGKPIEEIRSEIENW